MLDAGGRLVRAPGRLAAIGRHLRACARLREWGEAASLAQRLAEAEVGVVAIERLRQPATRNGMPAQLRDCAGGCGSSRRLPRPFMTSFAAPSLLPSGR